MVCSSSATTTTSSHSSINVTTSSSLSGIGSPNASSMFAGVDSFLPDYDSSLYSLWNAPGAYDTENDATQGQQQQVQPPLYMTPEDELKMDYPQLPEFNQDLDSYLNDAMDSGGHSPPTSTGNNHGGMMKMDHLVTTDRRTGAGASSVGAVGAASLTTGTQFETTGTSYVRISGEAGAWSGSGFRTCGEEISWSFRRYVCCWSS